MKKLLIGTAFAALAGLSAQAVDVKIYSSGYTENYGANIDFSSATLAQEFTAPDVSFGASQGNFNWHPGGLGSFGADFTGSVNAAGGNYFISLFSDDGSYMFIDGVLRISRPGAHGPDSTSATISLTPGVHTFEVQFFECCGGPSGVDAVLPQGVTFVPPTNDVPDGGSSLALTAGGIALLGAISRRLRK